MVATPGPMKTIKPVFSIGVVALSLFTGACDSDESPDEVLPPSCEGGKCDGLDLPETAGADKYDETAVAMIAVLKYGTGVPFKRLESKRLRIRTSARGEKRG